MKRHPSLEPFSRDHNVGLILARRASQAADDTQQARDGAASALIECWRDELEDHFAEEERLLGPLTPTHELLNRLIDEHRELGRYMAQLQAGIVESDILKSAGKLLHDHIRWEERELFAAIEETASPGQLKELSAETAKLESRRAHSTWSPRRGELMARRIGETEDQP